MCSSDLGDLHLWTKYYATQTSNIILKSGGNVLINSGNVGIGTTSPLAQLDIRSSISTGTAPTIYLYHGTGYGQISTVDAYHGLVMRGYPSTANDYSATAADQMSFYEYGGIFNFYTKNSSSLTLNQRFSGGTIYTTGDVVAYYSFSDARLKKNITPISNALDKVTQLNGVNYEIGRAHV